MSSFPSLPPPPCSPSREKVSSFLDSGALEVKEKEHSLWVNNLPTKIVLFLDFIGFRVETM